jgi:hypothetical protein
MPWTTNDQQPLALVLVLVLVLGTMQQIKPQPLRRDWAQTFKLAYKMISSQIQDLR